MKQIKTIINNTILIDNEELDSGNLVKIFYENGLNLEIITTNQDYLNLLRQKNFDCLLIHSDMSDSLTVKIIDFIKCNYPWMIVIVLLVNKSYEKVFELVRLGVDDFIQQPFTWEDIEKVYKHYNY